MKINLAVIPGDGIGPSVVCGAATVLNKVAEKFGHEIRYAEVDAGGISIDKHGTPLTDEAIEICRKSDSVLLGAVGGDKWNNIPDMRPEQALLGLRRELGLYTNLRPVKLFSPLKSASPLKSDILKNGLDIMIVRELTGGIYFGESGKGEDFAYDTEKYSVFEIRRVMKSAIDAANTRNRHITLVDKANVLESSRLWRSVAAEMLKDYPKIVFDCMYVDNASMQLIKNPSQFDVIVTSNMFGDILSDEASMLTGSIGMLPSASLGKNNFGMYEPIHGSAPDIAGMNLANPLATILSVAMMLKMTFGMNAESEAIEAAVEKTLQDGMRTADIANDEFPKNCGTVKMTEAVCKSIFKRYGRYE